MKIDIWLSWAEYITVIMMLIGFVIAATIDSMPLNLLVIFLAGLLGGRIIYERKKTTKFTHYMILIGFLLGYMIGSYSYNKKVIALTFFIGAILSYYLHQKGIIEKYEPVKDPHKQHW